MTIVTYVAPWYGPDVPGGAEAETRRTTQQLRRAGLDVEVLTTCLRDLYSDWGRNHHRPGLTEIEGVPVRRFPVEQRDRAAFDRLNWRLMNNLPISAAEEQVFINEMIRVPELYAFMRREAARRLYIFTPYMFSTTYFGAQVCPERSIIIPCLHEESYVHLGIYRQVLPAVRGLAFYTEAENRLADRLFAPRAGQIRRVVGGGVDADFTSDEARFRRKYGLAGSILLYAGRREAGKNTPLLLDYWARYVQDEGRDRDLTLVLIGPGEVQIPPAAAGRTVDLGFVPVQDKHDAYAAAAVFCMPSVHESFSIAVMESWLAGRPCLVHAGCDVTVEHSRQANGGLYFGNYDEFAAGLDFLLDHPQTAAQLGRQGRAYVLSSFTWDKVLPRYRQLFSEATAWA